MKPAHDPYLILGLPASASDAEIRARYLELTRAHPPEREPDRFREIHRAYQAAADPLAQAAHLLAPPGPPVDWADVLDDAAQNPPRYPTKLLLALGNRAPQTAAADQSAPTDP